MASKRFEESKGVEPHEFTLSDRDTAIELKRPLRKRPSEAYVYQGELNETRPNNTYASDGLFLSGRFGSMAELLSDNVSWRGSTSFDSTNLFDAKYGPLHIPNFFFGR